MHLSPNTPTSKVFDPVLISMFASNEILNQEFLEFDESRSIEQELLQLALLFYPIHHVPNLLVCIKNLWLVHVSKVCVKVTA